MTRVAPALLFVCLLSTAHGQEIRQSSAPVQEINQSPTPTQEVNQLSTHVEEINQSSTPSREVIQPSAPSLLLQEVNRPSTPSQGVNQPPAPSPLVQEIDPILAASPLIEIGPGGGDPGDPDDPGGEIYCVEGMWVCPCSPETECSAAPVFPQPQAAECYNELMYRPVTVTSYDLPVGAYHTFWWNQQIQTDGTLIEHVEDGGPTSPGSSCFTSNNCGTLFAALNIGDVGYYAADNIYTATHDIPDTYGPNLAQCQATWDMQYYTSTWPGGTIAYKILGPNSNTFAYEASVAAALTTTEPPVWVPGWSQ